MRTAASQFAVGVSSPSSKGLYHGMDLAFEEMHGQFKALKGDAANFLQYF
jgi:hypothetical protein